MDETTNLRLPYIMAAQAQKHVTHNEAIRALDCLVQLSVADRDLTTPPATPDDGARYIIAAGGTGAWSGHDLAIAAYQDGAWEIYTPREGWTAWVADEDQLLVWNGSAWIATASGGGGGSTNPTPLVGVNATADAVNRLSVASPASLFNHEGAGHQIKVNKATAADTGSLLFQTGFSGRAEMGLTGDDDYHFKVSSDGTTWHEAILIDKDTGEVTFPNSTIGGGSGGGVAPSVLVNGDFQINQRAFAGGALSAGAYGFDRWKAATGGANATLSGFILTLASGELEQVVAPGLWGLASFASQAVTVSVEAPSADLTVTFGTQSGTITAGSGRRSVTLTLGVGETGNLSFKVKRAAAGSVAFGRVKLEIGAAATDWQARPQVVERALCQHYFYRWGHENADTGTGFRMFGYGGAGVYEGQTIRHPVLMRATPTMTRSGTWTHVNITGTPSISDITPQSFSFSFQVTSTGSFDIISNSADDYIQADAEL